MKLVKGQADMIRTMEDDIVSAMGAATTSALPKISGLGKILEIGPLQSPPRDQVVSSRDDVISKATVNVLLLQSSAHPQETSWSLC